RVTRGGDGHRHLPAGGIAPTKEAQKEQQRLRRVDRVAVLRDQMKTLAGELEDRPEVRADSLDEAACLCDRLGPRELPRVEFCELAGRNRLHLERTKHER